MNWVFVSLLGLAELSLAPSVHAQDTANDKIFADQAIAAGLAEIAEVAIVLAQSENDNVRKYAHRIVADQLRADEELIVIAKSEGLVQPTLPTKEQAARIARLRGMTGADFDQAYMNGEVASHRAAVALYLQEIKSGADGALKQFAERVVPILNDELQLAQSLAAAR